MDELFDVLIGVGLKLLFLHQRKTACLPINCWHTSDCEPYDTVIRPPEQMQRHLLLTSVMMRIPFVTILPAKIVPIILGRANCRRKIEGSRTRYKQRNLIEREFGTLKVNRAIASRWDKLAQSLISMVDTATTSYLSISARAA